MGRRKGEGSKYKRTINGKTMFVYEVTRNGKKITSYSTKSYAEAHRKLMTKLEFSIKGEKILVKELAQRWLTYKKDKIKIQTWQNYYNIIKNHIVPELGEQYINQVTSEDVERIYVSSKLNPASIKQVNAVVKALFKYAIKNENASKDVTEDVELPTLEERQIRVLTEEECYHLLECAKGKKIYLPVRIALETGMRHGEILGLMYEDIIDCTIHVSRTVITRRDYENGEGFVDLNTPKGGSVRVIDITPELERLIKGDNKKSGLVFTSPRAKNDKKILPPQSLGSQWRILRKKAGFPDLRFHDLRHTHISHLINKGVPLPVVAHRAGHKRITTTLNTYTHLINRTNVSSLMSFEPKS